MTEERYKVGQILFVVMNKATSVVPVQVVEEITKKTINGEAKTYMIKTVLKDEPLYDIKKIKGEVFSSAQQVKETLIRRARSVIDKIVESAVSKASEHFEDGFENVDKGLFTETESEPESDSGQTFDFKPTQEDEYVSVQTPDGKIERVRMPKQVSN